MPTLVILLPLVVPLSRLRFRLFLNNLFLKNFKHPLLLLLFFPLLHHCMDSRFIISLAFVDLLKPLLNLQLMHFSLKHFLVLLEQLLVHSKFASFLSFLLVDAV